jgi:hypothetical protein
MWKAVFAMSKKVNSSVYHPLFNVFGVVTKMVMKQNIKYFQEHQSQVQYIEVHFATINFYSFELLRHLQINNRFYFEGFYYYILDFMFPISYQDFEEFTEKGIMNDLVVFG